MEDLPKDPKTAELPSVMQIGHYSFICMGRSLRGKAYSMFKIIGKAGNTLGLEFLEGENNNEY